MSSHTHHRPATRSDAPSAPADDQPTVSGAFTALGVPAPLVKALAASGVTEPFAIQSAAIPDALVGRDLLGRAHTGSGKTVAFAVPVVARLSDGERTSSGRRPRGLILVPTRELAAQVSATVAPLARAAGLRTATVHGGVSPVPQIKALRQGAEIVIATPGRLEDLIAQGQCRLSEVEVTVLDEADQMADLGFLPAVRRLLAQTPSDGQRLLFSATLDGAVDVLAREYLRDPVTHSIHAPDAGPDLLEHRLVTIPHAERVAAVAELVSGHDRSLLFTRTKHGARKLSRQLIALGIRAEELHSNLTQSARRRNLFAFASGQVSVLVATDIAARGIHIDEVSLVVHVDPPAEHKAYLHRSGRTARAGAAGIVVTMATPEQLGDVKALLRKAKVSVSPAPPSGAHRDPTPAPAPAGRPAGRHPKRATEGTVRWFHTGRGYGFITPDGGSADLFVHHSSIQAGAKGLSPGQRVRFEAAPGAKGTQATKVRAA